MNELVIYLLLASSFAEFGSANRVYVHPFNLFALDNATCEVLTPATEQELEVMKAPLLSAQDKAEADLRNPADSDGLGGNSTERLAYLVNLQNHLGLRMYNSLRDSQRDSNTLFSPMDAYETLVTLYLGASKKTAVFYRDLLGIVSPSEGEGCVYLFDGHKVLLTLQEVTSLMDSSQDKLKTLAWSFISQDAEISKDFVRGTRDFSDASFTRSVDFSKPEEAKEMANSFVHKTSDGNIKQLFQNISSATNFLFASSLHFKGSWATFKPESMAKQDFKVDEQNTLSIPMMTHTGKYEYLDDTDKKCTVVKLPLANQAYMLLLLPHEGVDAQDIELKQDDIDTWNKHLKEGYLELSLPKISGTALTDLKSVLTHMRVDNYLFGSDDKYRRLSNKEKFTVDQVYNAVVFEISEEQLQDSPKTEEETAPRKLTVNKPFLFAIFEGNSDAIVLMGKIRNPVE